jgi:hypothetical protein
MNERNGQQIQPELPFGGNGPLNLNRQQLQQAWNLQSILNYQAKVRELTEALRLEDMQEGMGRE